MVTAAIFQVYSPTPTHLGMAPKVWVNVKMSRGADITDFLILNFLY